jgi:transposase
MKVPTKFVKTLLPEQRNKLIDNHQNSDNFRLRNRSQAILLSFDKFSIDDIAKICRVDRDTVSRWLDNWNEFGETGLQDSEKSGRPPILTPEEQQQALEIALQNPRFPHRQLSKINKHSGKPISQWTLKNLIKKKTIFGNE